MCSWEHSIIVISEIRINTTCVSFYIAPIQSLVKFDFEWFSNDQIWTMLINYFTYWREEYAISDTISRHNIDSANLSERSFPPFLSNKEGEHANNSNRRNAIINRIDLPQYHNTLGMILTPHTKIEPKHNPNKAHIKNRPLINNTNNPRNTQT